MHISQLAIVSPPPPPPAGRNYQTDFPLMPPIRSYHGVSAAHPEKLPKLALRMRDIYDIALFAAAGIVTISFGRPGGKKIQGGFSRWYDVPRGRTNSPLI